MPSAIGCGSEKTKPRRGAQDAVHLAEEAAEVGHRPERLAAERDVDRVGPQERQVGQVARLQLEPDLCDLGRGTSGRDAIRGAVDADDRRALPGEADRGVTRPAPELEHALALHRTEQTDDRVVLHAAGA